MVIAPVRLDKWQNIINVGWPDGENQPPPGDLVAPQLWDWQPKRNDTDQTTLTMNPWEGSGGGFFEDAVEGDLLIGHILGGRATAHGDPWPIVSIGLPGNGNWIEAYQFSAQDNGGVGSGMTSSLAYKWVTAAEAGPAEIDYTWTFSPSCPVMGSVFRVIDPFPFALPFPDAGFETHVKETTGIAIANDFSITRNNALLLGFIHCNSNFNTSGVFPLNPSGSGSYTRRTFERGFGDSNGNASIAYDADDEPGPGAIGARNLSISTGFHTILGHLAIIGNPV